MSSVYDSQPIAKKKKGFNPNELRKTIVTKIDKDGFHEQTVTYGKDSEGSIDTAAVRLHNDLANSVVYFQFPEVAGPSENLPVRIAIGNKGIFGGNTGVCFTLLANGFYEINPSNDFEHDGIRGVSIDDINIASGDAVITEYGTILVRGNCEINIMAISGHGSPAD